MLILKNIYKYLLGIYHYLLAWLGNVMYRRPSRYITVIGVTGTKGKTTTVELLSEIFRKDGKHVASSSSLQVRIDDRVLPKKTATTMPGRFFVKRFLRQAVQARCDVAILEVTSQGVVQHRARFIDFDVCVFLNLSPEHIESHGSFENYRDAKIKFFKDAARDSRKPQKFFVMNKIDGVTPLFHKAVLGKGESLFFGSDTTQKFQLSDWLTPAFNKMNAGAAVTVAETFHISESAIQKALKDFGGVQGRMEYVVEKPFAVVVDYAHTPDSLEAIYTTLRARHKGNLVCVLSAAGGGRDTWKRPAMGEVAGRRCDAVILTDEDPYDEDPRAIIDEIQKGIPKNTAKVFKILDRKEAIKKALSLAKPGDAVVLTGKGAERSIHVAHGKEIPWSDQETVRGLIRDQRPEVKG